MNTTNKERKNGTKYGVRIASSRVEKQLDSLPRQDYSRIKAIILSLAGNPRPVGVKKLSDSVHRIRVGNFRVIYSIFDKEKIILIDKVCRRSESTYKNFG